LEPTWPVLLERLGEESYHQLNSVPRVLTCADYERLSTYDLNDTLQYSATGTGLAMLSNRLSWFYDING
jgi:hypothetical protein